MLDLPLDERGYPIPWFVLWIDGKPDFRVMDEEKRVRAVRERICWCCGKPLGDVFAFVSGPMCGMSRTSSEPPAHLECALWSVKGCPFLSLPKATRRDVGLPDDVKTPGILIPRNPGVALVWITDTYKTFNVKNGFLMEMGEPIRVEWYAQGRPATRAEVQASITAGLPALQDLAMTDPHPGAVQHLCDTYNALQKLVPHE